MDVEDTREPRLKGLASTRRNKIESLKAGDCISDGWLLLLPPEEPLSAQVRQNETKNTVNYMHNFAFYMGHLRAHWLNQIQFGLE